MPLTPEAKQLLSSTIRSLREVLLKDLQAEAEGRYQLAVPIAKAGLDEAHRVRRTRLERHLDEQLRASGVAKKDEKAARDRLFKTAVKQAAATFLNRIIALRHLEALGLSKPSVLTGGWNSKGYRELREFAPALTSPESGDETGGYATLLGYVFDEMAVDLPGLFGDVGISALFPIRPATLREVVERLDEPALASAWTDDTTLGWVYQYWNDPEREALDAKINARGKIEPHEIASKTQMFTERYMVEWLLQNSLGLTWLCICKKRGWTPDAERVLPALDERRAEWRAKREAGEVALDALMPIRGELEDRWKYYVPQPIPEDAVEKAPRSVRDLKILDPACGSGHFLVIAFDLLVVMYREEARLEGRETSDRKIAESILENNLFGIDIDPRATQIAAAGLLIKARQLDAHVQPEKLNVVAPEFHIGRLPKDDPALVTLRERLQDEVGITDEVTDQLLATLAGVDHLGSLLRIDTAVDAIMAEFLPGKQLYIHDVVYDAELEHPDPRFGGRPQRVPFGTARQSVLQALEEFLSAHSRSDDLGLRLEGEQLAAGVRFVRMVKEGTYDIVVGNPPYQGTSKMADAGYVAQHYPMGKADLYAAFLERGLQLVREGGLSALVTMRGWMFVTQFRELREAFLREHDLQAIVDLDSGAFEEVSAAQVVLSVACSVFAKRPPSRLATALRPTPTEDRTSAGMAMRKRAGLLAQVGRHDFDPRGFEVIEGEPIVYWWPKQFLAEYATSPKLKALAPVKVGLQTSDNSRYLRCLWEVGLPKVCTSHADSVTKRWAPYIKGAEGRCWIEPLLTVANWWMRGTEVKLASLMRHGSIGKRVANEDVYFQRGVAFPLLAQSFGARLHSLPSIIDVMGASVFGADLAMLVCTLNSRRSRNILEGLNPTIHFTVGDVERLAVTPVRNADAIVRALELSFSEHERTREPSSSFFRPGPSCWTSAQAWAQRAVDRPEGDPLPLYEPGYSPPKPTDFVSFALGVALGRFAAEGNGALDDAAVSALPQGILYLSATPHPDGLAAPVSKPLLEAWHEHGSFFTKNEGLGDYLRRSFFNDVHRPMYENRPIYFPLSSAKKNFVAYALIHRFMPTWNDVERTGVTWDEAEKRGFTWDSFGDTALHVLLADHLLPERRHLEGELEDLRKARAEAGKKGSAEKRFAEVQKLLEELNDFIEKVTQIAEKGPPPPDDKTPPREVDARFAMDLDDGVMVNSAALWPLLEPQWKDPKKWWKELATAKGRKDYDWSHLAERYFPKRVHDKCLQDPSLAVAHGRFWALWPEKAYAWELRLQDEIREGFTIDEPGLPAHHGVAALASSNEARERFLADHPAKAAELRAAEDRRRERKAAKADSDSEGPLFDGALDDDDGAEEDGDV